MFIHRYENLAKHKKGVCAGEALEGCANRWFMAIEGQSNCLEIRGHS